MLLTVRTANEEMLPPSQPLLGWRERSGRHAGQMRREQKRRAVRAVRGGYEVISPERWVQSLRAKLVYESPFLSP